MKLSEALESLAVWWDGENDPTDEFTTEELTANDHLREEGFTIYRLSSSNFEISLACLLEAEFQKDKGN